MHDDLLYALRALKGTPGPVFAAVLTLALAIGINAGMVGLIDRAVFRAPEHIADPDRLVTLGFERGEGNQRVRMSTTSYVTYLALRDGVRAFDRVSAFQPTQSPVVLDGEQIQLDTMLVGQLLRGGRRHREDRPPPAA